MYTEEELDVLSRAAAILKSKIRDEKGLISSSATRDYLKCKLASHERECFAVMYLDNQHRVLAFSILFQGTIDGAAVYPREVIKEALQYNAAALIFAHNHPSGVSEPSQADVAITRKLVSAAGTIDIRVLDHFVVTAADCVSLAERGLI